MDSAKKIDFSYYEEVLILIVMEVALGLAEVVPESDALLSLNPYCNGGRTWTGVFTNTYKPAEYTLEFKNLNTFSCRFNTLITAKLRRIHETYNF